MTHPLTPREKVPSMPTVELTDDMLFEVSAGEVITWAEINRRTALASGSGDHAELADGKACGDRMIATADALMPWLKNYPPSTRRERAIEAANAAAAASCGPLLAENAALRGERDEWRDTAFKARSSNTRAERKLAEAVGLNDRAAELMRQCTDPERFEGASTLNVYANMRAWLSDLSKEAERG